MSFGAEHYDLVALRVCTHVPLKKLNEFYTLRGKGCDLTPPCVNAWKTLFTSMWKRLWKWGSQQQFVSVGFCIANQRCVK